MSTNPIAANLRAWVYHLAGSPLAWGGCACSGRLHDQQRVSGLAAASSQTLRAFTWCPPRWCAGFIAQPCRGTDVAARFVAHG